MAKNSTDINESLLTPCPSCGARCYALIDLDNNSQCRECCGPPDAELAALAMADFQAGKVYASEGTGKGYKGWAKGQSGNPAGRPKGSKNKTTDEIRKFVQGIIGDNLPRFQDDLDRMKPYQRMDTIIKLMRYVMPTLVQSDVEAEETGRLVVKVVYGDDVADEDVNNPTPDIEVQNDNSYGYTEEDDEDDFINPEL